MMHLAEWTAAEGATRKASVLPFATANSTSRIKVGTHTAQGYKKQFPGRPNQDVHYVSEVSPGLLFVGVFDGHGRDGHHVANRVCAAFAERASDMATMYLFRGEQKFRKFINDMFAEVHEEVSADPTFDTWSSGTTATVALVNVAAETMTVAHVGDSTLMICEGHEVDFVTRDHVVDEAARRIVHHLGGEVRFSPARVYSRGQNTPGLMMSRSLGDGEAHQIGVSCMPEVCTIPFRSGSTLVLCSDGVWEHMTHEGVAEYLVTQAK
jgi:serine/threonine protein phosphatase PrpC